MFAVEGVLGTSDDFHVNMLQDDTALRLYASLADYNRVVLVTSHPTAEHVDWWLRTHGIHDYAQVVCSLLQQAGSVAEEREAQLRALRAARTAVGLVVDSDPATVAHAMSVGVTGLLYGPPRPAAKRVDLGARRIRDWSDIETEIGIRREAGA